MNKNKYKSPIPERFTPVNGSFAVRSRFFSHEKWTIVNCRELLLVSSHTRTSTTTCATLVRARYHFGATCFSESFMEVHKAEEGVLLCHKTEAFMHFLLPATADLACLFLKTLHKNAAVGVTWFFMCFYGKSL